MYRQLHFSLCELDNCLETALQLYGRSIGFQIVRNGHGYSKSRHKLLGCLLGAEASFRAEDLPMVPAQLYGKDCGIRTLQLTGLTYDVYTAFFMGPSSLYPYIAAYSSGLLTRLFHVGTHAQFVSCQFSQDEEKYVGGYG